MPAGIRNKHGSLPVKGKPSCATILWPCWKCSTAARSARPPHAPFGLRRWLAPIQVVGLDVARDQTDDGRGLIEFYQKKGGLRCGARPAGARSKLVAASSDATCPVVALQTWLKLARIAHGPLFRRVPGLGKVVGAERLNGRRRRGWSNARPWPPACAGMFRRPSANRSFSAIRCALASRPQPRSTSAMCKSAWPRKRRDDPQVPARPFLGQPHQGVWALKSRPSPDCSLP